MKSYKTAATRVEKLQNRSDKGWKVTKQERQGLESYKIGATRVGKLQNRSDKGWKVTVKSGSVQ